MKAKCRVTKWPYVRAEYVWIYMLYIEWNDKLKEKQCAVYVPNEQNHFDAKVVH